ncbi:hypothetical protein P280DRAFT_520869 [Massarina eburnea CBS 473.64]|uniref:Uncharacterized protein n=1 Tax=Massarina eburnea CBS 473.64 TaxID=1395130 RepID=A0A6A6RTM9_9PLEO|nr:hypothetical protein P280DRAFT_520869 [Massarina eburnea CBS 473.64]
MPTSLQNLPIELISALVPYLIPQHQRVYPTYTDLSSLYALRLTSRGLYDKTLFDFSRLAFSTIHVDFTLFGLDRFYEISQHEEFRKSVRNIYFAHDFHVRLGLVDEEKKGTAESQGFTGLEEVVNGRLGEVFSEIFQRLDRLEKIVIVTPFAAIYSWFWERGSNNSDNCPDILGPSSYHYERYTLTTTTLVLFVCAITRFDPITLHYHGSTSCASLSKQNHAVPAHIHRSFLRMRWLEV